MSTRPLLMPALALALTLAVGGCKMLGLGTGESNGSGGGAATADADAGTATGTGCGTDPASGVTICLGISLCPNLVMDGEAFPGCGFRVNGDALDVECLCSGWLCPLGATATCDEVTQALAASNEGTVCAKVSGGACVELGTSATTSSSSSGGSGTCDTICRGECAGDPTCIAACGC